MRPDRRIPVAIGLDVFVVVLFVAIGRRNHDEGSAVGGLLAVAAPFLFGLAAGWLASRAWRRPWHLSTGVAVAAVAVAVGMVVRRLVLDRGTAPAFVIVTTLFLCAGLIGWRALARLLPDRSPAAVSEPSSGR